MSRFSFRPALTMRGRTRKGLRGLSGKPFHPPLTDIPIAAYLLVAAMDVLSVAGGHEHRWARELWHAATWVFLAGLAVSILAALTGLVDARSSSEAGTQARRTINAHALFMVTATVLAILAAIWRLTVYDTALVTPGLLTVLSVVIALLVTVGATYGGSLVFDYGFNVETAGDHPVWHRSDTDVLPGDH